MAGRIIILGAGLSGLSIACALVEQGVPDDLVLLDARTDWRRDRTWCTWLSPGLRFAEVSDHRWHSWRISSPLGQATSSSARHPYIHLNAELVYEAALERLAAARNVELRRGAPVQGVNTEYAHLGRLSVTAGGATVEGRLLIDAMGPASPLNAQPSQDSAAHLSLLGAYPAGSPADPRFSFSARLRPRTRVVELPQTFVGWEVKTERPVFTDIGTATLMDFTYVPDDPNRFLYVLPTARDRALIEDTSLGGSPVTDGERRRALARHLRQTLNAGEWTTTYEERATILMSTRNLGARRPPNVLVVGAAGGAVRPSSGYAFSRIQDHCTRLATHVAAGLTTPLNVNPNPRTGYLDKVFLNALSASPAAFPEVFRRMNEHMSGDAFARFMVDRSSVREELRLVAAVPRRPFVNAAARILMTR